VTTTTGKTIKKYSHENFLEVYRVPPSVRVSRARIIEAGASSEIGDDTTRSTMEKHLFSRQTTLSCQLD
jgi:hypothetical protein